MNVNGLPVHDSHHKDNVITDCIPTHQLDLLGLAEINLNFNILRPPNQWKDRFKKLKTHKVHSYNTHSTSQDTRLFGGTAIVTGPCTNHRTIDHGCDPSGLGRWTWIQLRGKQNMVTRIVVGIDQYPIQHIELGRSTPNIRNIFGVLIVLRIHDKLS